MEGGAYWVVHRAKDEKTDGTVALKGLKVEKKKDHVTGEVTGRSLKAQPPDIVPVSGTVAGSHTTRHGGELHGLMETMGQPFLPRGEDPGALAAAPREVSTGQTGSSTDIQPAFGP
ncbi:hypothetical protein CB1_000394028 [Camelus ferus]|nr:hypothetical protein CB1_000394028 [Camelus ferus]